MIKVNVSQDTLQALEICAQLLDVGSFQLSGKELGIAAQAKALLVQLISEAKSGQSVDAEVIDQTPTKASRAAK